MYKNRWKTLKADIFYMLKRQLDRRELSPEEPYWLMEEQCKDYCLDCIKAKKADFDFHADYGDFFDGGFECESDSSCQCADCGKLLNYTLTDDGVDNEIEVWDDGGFDWDNRAACFVIARIAYGAFSSKQKCKALKIMIKGNNCPVLVLRDTPIPVRVHAR